MNSSNAPAGQIPGLLTGTETALVAEVPGAGGRWKQVHFNQEVMRRFFHLERDNGKSITLERIAGDGTLQSRMSRQLVFSTANSNSKIEFDFDPLPPYPTGGERPMLVIVEADYLTFRFRLVMPSASGHEGLQDLLSAGSSVGRGLRRRIVTLDDVEAYWPTAALRGA